MNERLNGSLFILACLLVGTSIERMHSVDDPGVSRPRSATTPRKMPDAIDHDSLDSDAATIVDNDPFRLSNRPSAVRYASIQIGSVSPPQVRPQFVLRAIVGGPPWSAILDGIPGQQGSVVVTSGLTFDKWRIRSVTRDTVVVQAPDTAWRLTLRTSP